ncbi:TPA: hypothetical protein N0F65_005828 [Lagenidium giganteum]|uniref:Crinkler effector protein N-terminal domain-containing protein n=1 Tax=Lagenidium giganteum TaxID=4803 RepID=A0AAV2YIN4_9STRA|nr:TPA: hypothetical protein N0F65_005828 [Lagenidium giganteum]
MKSLVCVVIGDESVFGVDIEDRKKVWQLKEMIKEKNLYSFAAKDLKLYVAKKGDNWLKSSDPTQIKDIMKQNGEMDGSYRMLNTAFGFPDEDDAEDGDIHVLVDIPEYIKKSLRILRYNQQDVSQDLPMDSGLSPASAWDWLATFFSSPRKASPSKKDV